jgi:hypothetical protein
MTASLSQAAVTTTKMVAGLRVARTLTTTLLLVALGCHGDTAERNRALEKDAARRLVGAWDATLWLDHPVTLATAPSTLPRRVAGSLAFLEDHYGTLSPGELGDPTHIGVYDIDFRSFGFQLQDVNGVPTAVARTTARATTTPPGAAAVAGPDSVTIVLAPGTSQYPCRLAGVFMADSITGIWTAGQLLGGGGRFSLRRHRTQP